MTTPEPDRAASGAAGDHRGHDELGRRLDGLIAAVDAARGRLDEEALAAGEALRERAAERLALSGRHTIVALAGATGSGKSSLFNALTDMELAGVGVRRPTTSWALACAWGPDGATELLTWMGIAPRHQVSRMGLLERSDDTSLEGLILLDLPDHDSTEVAHHLEMDRLVTHSDMLVWVLDPQKYADAAIHERYIRPMAAHAAVTLVVLNQIDRIPAEDRESALADVRQLIEADGVHGAVVLGVSATRGDGLGDLRRELAGRILAKSAARARLSADVVDAAVALADVGGTAEVPSLSPQAVVRLEEAIADAAGLHHVVDRVDTAVRRGIVRRTHWPLLVRSRRVEPVEFGQVSEPSVELAVQDLVDDTVGELARPWRTSIRRAAPVSDVTAGFEQELRDRGRLDRPPRWSRAVQIVQWLLVLGLVAGLVGLGSWALERWSDVESPLPDFGSYLDIPAGGWAAGAALVAGLLLDVVSRLAARSSARRRARRLDDEVRASISGQVDDRVVVPIRGEIERYRRYRDGAAAALS